MYLSKHFFEGDQNKLLEICNRYPFGTLVIPINEDIEILHIPLLTKTVNREIWIEGHAAKANPFLQKIERPVVAKVIFHGPQAFVSPSFYPNPKEVPTWNYIVVHATGLLTLMKEKDWAMEHVRELSYRHDSNWIMNDTPDYVQSLLPALVGFRVHVTSLIGNFKLSQNKSYEERKHVIESLRRSEKSIATDLADWMERY